VGLLFSIFAVAAGLVFGSFLNVCISRLPRHESVVRPRSHCPVCEAPIRSFDNIPILSWLLLKGRCRSCGARIPVRYPLIELASAALFLLCWLEYGLTFEGVSVAVLCWLLLGLAATDAETLLLPDALTLPGIVLGVVYSGFLDSGSAFSWRAAGWSLLWAGCGAALILLIRGAYWVVRRKEGIGLGDAKLLAMIAAWLQPEKAALVVFLAVVGAAVYGLALMLASRLRRDGEVVGRLRIPLGAFLSGAGIFAVFRGGDVLIWYLGFFR